MGTMIRNSVVPGFVGFSNEASIISSIVWSEPGKFHLVRGVVLNSGPDLIGRVYNVE